MTSCHQLQKLNLFIFGIGWVYYFNFYCLCVTKEFSIMWRTFSRTCKFFNEILKKVWNRCMWWIISSINKRAVTIVSIMSRVVKWIPWNCPSFHMMALIPLLSSPLLCYSKSHKFNNYEKAPYKIYSYSQANFFTRVFACPQTKLSSHVTIDIPTNTF